MKDGQLLMKDDHLVMKDGQLVMKDEHLVIKDGQLVMKDDHLLIKDGQLLLFVIGRPTQVDQQLTKDSQLVIEDGHLLMKDGQLLMKVCQLPSIVSLLKFRNNVSSRALCVGQKRLRTIFQGCNLPTLPCDGISNAGLLLSSTLQKGK